MASINASRYLEEIHPSLQRNGRGDIQITAKQTVGESFTKPINSILVLDTKSTVNAQAQRHANDLLSAAEDYRLRGKELEARLLANQAEYETVAADLRNIDFGAEHEAKREQLMRLRDDARILDQTLHTREQADRDQWDEMRIAKEWARDLDDRDKRTMATEYSNDYRDQAVKARMEDARKRDQALNMDSTERIDTRLARKEDGSLQSNYASNSLRGAHRTTLEDYADSLKQEAANFSDPVVKARYERQAQFELEWEMRRMQPTYPPELRRLQVEQADVDLSSSSLFQDSARTRLDNAAEEEYQHNIDEDFELDKALEIKEREYMHNDRIQRERAKKGLQQNEADIAVGVKSQLFESLHPTIQAVYDKSLEKAQENLSAQHGHNHQMSVEDLKGFERGLVEDISKLIERLQERKASLKDPQQLNTGAITGTSNEPNRYELKPRNIPGYEASMTDDQKAIVYKNTSTSASAFRDEGPKVRMEPTNQKKSPRDDDIRAGTRLAAEKFDKFSISGSKDFREKAAKIAGELGLADRVSNPELRQIAQKEEQRLKAEVLSGSFQDAALQQLDQTKDQQIGPDARQEKVSTQENPVTLDPQSKPLTASEELPSLSQARKDPQAADTQADAATQQKGARAEDAAEELPSPKRSATAQAATDSNELPSPRTRSGSARPEVETATSTATNQEELPSPRSSNARQTLQSLDSQQAASDELPQARSDDVISDAATLSSASMSRSR